MFYKQLFFKEKPTKDFTFLEIYINKYIYIFLKTQQITPTITTLKKYNLKNIQTLLDVLSMKNEMKLINVMEC